MGAMNRRLRALERRVADRGFEAGAPPLDSEGLPIWDASEPLTIAGYLRALGFEPETELTEAEAEARERLSPYAQVFAQLERDAKPGGADVS